MKSKSILIIFVVIIVSTIFALIMFKGKTNYFSFLNLNEKGINDPNTANIVQKEKYGFYPNLSKDISISEPIMDENGGKTILIQSSNLQAQIYISPFDEDIILTMEMIKQDIPDLKMGDEGEVKIDGIPGVKFIDLDQNTNEIWFVRGGYLYQISGSAESDELTNKIINNWRWNISNE